MSESPSSLSRFRADSHSIRQLLYRLPLRGRAAAVGKGAKQYFDAIFKWPGSERRVHACQPVHGRIGMVRVVLAPPIYVRGAQC